MLKPQDIVILLKMISAKEELSQNRLAVLLCMSPSEVNAGIKRLISAELLSPIITNNAKKNIIYKPNKKACEECLINGVKYFFPAQLGTYTRGIATSYAAPILEKHIISGDEPIPVWPHGQGDIRGLTLEPLYSSVPKSITQYPDQLFYDLLVLVDVIRSGRARERNIAIKLLKEVLYDNNEARQSESKFKDTRAGG